MTNVWLHEHLIDDGRWRPFAWSLGATLLVAGAHTGVFDWVLLHLWFAQHLGG